MKKHWNALGIAAIAAVAAAAVPVKFKKDEKTGKKTYQSLLMSLDIGPGEDDEHTAIGLNIGDGVLSSIFTSAVAAKKEGVLFADDEPEAAVVEPIAEMETAAEETAAVAEEAEDAVEEAVAAAEEAEDVVEEAVAEVEETKDTVEEGVTKMEESFDPEM